MITLPPPSRSTSVQIYAVLHERRQDNHTRQELNIRIRQELKKCGNVSGPDQQVQVLVPRQDMTGADRAWAAQYREGDVIRYTKGSEQHSIRPGEYATVRDVDSRQNTLRVETKEGRQVEYDPRRLRGVSVYEKAERNFSPGDRVQLTAPDRASGLANRELGQIERIAPSGAVHIRTDSGKTASVRGDHKHLDHGYAVTSHSAQGTTADRVIVHAEGGQPSALVNQRFAYVSGSRMREGLQVYTDDSHRLESSLSRRSDKSAAIGERAIGQGSSHGESGASQSTKAPGHSQTKGGGHQEMGHTQ